MGDVFARDENSGLTVSIPVTQVYRVTYNGRYVGLFAQDEYAQLTSYKPVPPSWSTPPATPVTALACDRVRQLPGVRHPG